MKSIRLTRPQLLTSPDKRGKRARLSKAHLVLLALVIGLGLGWLHWVGVDPVRAATITVTTTDDNGDNNNPTTGSLRAAIKSANDTGGDDVIAIAPGVTGNIQLAGVLPDLSTNITINGPGANLLTVRRNSGGDYRIFTISAGATVALAGLTITNGYPGTGNSGGGIFNEGTLTVTDCAVTNNLAGSGLTIFSPANPGGAGGHGGGIQNAGTLSINRSTISQNQAGPGGNGGTSFLPTGSAGAAGGSGGSGGGINSTGTLTISNSTVSNNQAGAGGAGSSSSSIIIGSSRHAGGSGGNGGGINANTLTVTNSTFHNNRAGSAGNAPTFGPPPAVGVGGGINALTPTLTNCTITNNQSGSGGVGGGVVGTTSIRNSILALNTPNELQGTLTNLGHNLFGGDPRLGPLQDNGGPTVTRALLFDSPAFDAGDNCVVQPGGCLATPLTTDQRGLSRQANLTVDIGAVEAQSLSVTNTNDSGSGSLRQAISDINANQSGGASLIAFQSGLTGTINLQSALPALSSDLAIIGPGANLVTVKRNTGGTYRIFTISPGVTVAISGLTITHGDAGNDFGGAILNAGALTINSCTVSGNTAVQGGGIFSSVTLVINRSTISGNHAVFTGGGIYNYLDTNASASGSTVISNSTISDNQAHNGDGGGIWSAGDLSLVSSTVTANTARTGGGGVFRFNTSPSPEVRSCIIAGNTSPSEPDVKGVFVSQGHNLIGKSDGANGFTQGSHNDIVGTSSPVDAKLGPLQSIGGPTQTRALLSGSPALDAGDNCVTLSTGGCLAAPLTTDQRGPGFPRVRNGTVDIGAFESCGVGAISAPPVSQTVCLGSPATFSVGATGAGLSYQWRNGGVSIGGATGSSYTIASATLTDVGNYDVVVTDECGTSLTSNAVTLALIAMATISTHPSDQTVDSGGTATFTAAASGTPAPTVQWQVSTDGGANFNNLSGATNPTLTLSSVIPAQSDYKYRAIFTNGCGMTVTSSVATLTVTPLADMSVTVTGSPNPVVAGAVITYTITVTNNGPDTATSVAVNNSLPPQAKAAVCKGPDGKPCGGASGKLYAATSGLPPGVSFTVTVTATVSCSAPHNSELSNTASVTATTKDPNTSNNSQTTSTTVQNPTSITAQPASQTACVGNPVTFSVTAAGAGQSYQWRKGGLAIPGATASSFTINAVAAGDAGNYDVVMTGAACAVTSNVASLTVNAATAILVQPANQALCPGGSATFNVVATGAALSYQWRKGGSAINGATSSSFTLNPVVAGDAGNYDVVVTGACGTVTSAAANLTVNAPNINTQPTNQTACPGSPVVFSVSATGAGLSYQWRKGGAAIPGATANSYAIAAVTAADAGNYDVAVSGGCVTVNSNAASLTVNPATAITTQPTNQTACAGGPATFSVTAAGVGLSYQWRKAGVNLNGATASSFTIPAVVAGDAGNYEVIVTGTCGTVSSTSASLTVNPATTITAQPTNQTACLGSPATFSVTAAGTSLSYQWRKGGSAINGATGSSFTIPAIVAGDAAQYDVVVTGTCGTATSTVATLSITSATALTAQPTSQTVCVGAPVSLAVTASGVGLSYQWRKGGLAIPGATGSSFTIAAAAAGDAGNYDVVVTGSCSALTSNPASLTVNPATAITAQPTNQASCLGGAVTFHVTAIGAGLSYQWRKGGAPVNGATGSSFTVQSVAAGDAGNYDVVVTGACGTVNSNAASLTIYSATNINTQPTNQTTCLGGSATFTVGASGAGTLSYQWRKGGNPINGATGSSLTLNPVVAGDAAQYDVVVTSSCGTVTSQSVALTINAGINLTAQPVNRTVCAGAPVSFAVTAGGANLSYQWRKNGTNINGATASSYAIATTVVGDAAQYDVIVTGACGSVTSNAASLIVNAAPAIIAQPANQAACLGGAVTFQVAATGAGLSYQWRKGGVSIPGATGASSTILAVAAGDAGSYDVVITGTCGTLTSQPAVLTLNSAININTQPANQTACLGGSASFSVSATGAGLSYQWRKGGVNINGATASSFAIAAVTAAEAGIYDVVVNGTCGTLNSQAATLTVNPATAITTQPASQTKQTGQSVTFSASATGANLSYQWRKAGTNISGATASSFTIAAVALSDAAPYDVVVTGTCGNQTSAPATLTVTCATITLSALPNGVQGVNYNQTITATPAGGNYTFAKIAGELPPGLNLASTGALSGTPTAPGSYSFTIQATVANDCFGTHHYTLQVGCPTLTLAALPNATAGSAYNAALTASPAGGAYQFSSADKPVWLTLAGNGGLNGTPPSAGTFAFNVSVTGFGNCTQMLSVTLTVNCPALSFSPETLPNGVQGTAYSQTLTANPAGGNYNYTLATGILPPGLTLASNGTLSGTPTAGGNYAFAVKATGWGACLGTQTYNLLITGTCAALTLDPATLPGATLGTAYHQTLTGNPAGAYSFSVTQGALPNGLTLAAQTGVISGTPTAGGTYSFRVTATGAGGCSGSRSYVVMVSCGTWTFTPATLPNGTRGGAYSQQLSVSSANNATFSLLLGSLPLGFTLSSGGLLGGITTQSGTYNFTVKALAATGGGCQGTKAYSLVIGGGNAALAMSGDYDGDGQSDPTLWSARDGVWRIIRSSQNQAVTQSWGAAGDVALLGDYDGDGKSDLAVFRPSNATFYIKQSSGDNALVKQWGLATDVPVPGDYDGDGKTDVAVWRGSTGSWYIVRSSDGQSDMVAWGSSATPYNDVPVAGDYDGDSKSDVAVFRRGNGTWLVRRSSDGQFLVKQWGVGTDIPVANDYDGDGRCDFAVWRGSNGTWYIWRSATNDYSVGVWGSGNDPYRDQAVPGDFDGDGQADLAVWRAPASTWFVKCSADGALLSRTHGQSGDEPIAARP